MSLQILMYAAIPVICALIGWITNYLAVKMIFRPRRPFRVFGITCVGLIPKRRADLARKIAETVERELISHRDIEEVLKTPAVHDTIRESVRGRIDTLFDQILAANPLIGMFLQGETAQTIRGMLISQLEKEIPPLLDTLMGKIESTLDFHKIVREKIEGFDLDKLENIVYAIASRELKAIEIFGGALGFAVGCAQVAILVAANMVG